MNDISLNGITAQLTRSVNTQGELLDKGLIKGREKMLVLMKVNALLEITNFINMYPLWTRSTRNAENRFNDWCKPLSSAPNKSARKMTKERVEKEMIEKIGVSTIQKIHSCATQEELLKIVHFFRETSGIRYIKRSYLVDLLIFAGINVRSTNKYMQIHLTDVFSILDQKVVTANPKQFFYLFHLEGKRWSPNYGKEKKYLKYALSSIVDIEDEYFAKARKGLSLYLQNKINFAQMIYLVRETVQDLEEVLV
ncbi:hypothetical protein [Ureibacillus thermosphaericus]|uniref:hypothetical protein n=1 Tax=Ureibacillus thermosphaericus TaxID=51173 RepID=UPI000BBBE3CB|nr:hypothetical protein [Ureibacillus thermosphaericus]